MQSQFTQLEGQLVQSLVHPSKVQHFLYKVPYNYGATVYSFRQVVAQNKAHCLEGALFAATVLEQHGYDPIFLDLESVDDIDHVLFLFKEAGLYGTVAVSRDIGLHGRRPVFQSIEALVSSYYEPYINEHACITGYGTFDLRELGSYDWRFRKANCKKVENALIELPHKLFCPPKQRYEKELARYKKYCQMYPEADEFPMDYFKNQHQWW